MPIRTIATIAVAALLGLVAVFLVQSYLSRQRAADASQAVIAGTAPVVVAAQPLARGVALNPTLLKVVRYPQDSVPPGALSDITQATAGGQRLVLRAFAANEPILESRITTPGGRLNLSAAMTQGMRAVTFRSNDVAGVAGFVLPGDRVDVMLTRAGGDGAQAMITQVLAQNIKVLAVDQLADDSADTPVVATAITIEVTPEQAQTIRLAEAVGSVSLALRQVSDQLPVNKRVTTIRDIGGYLAARPAGAAAAPTAVAALGPPQERGPKIRVTRGIETQVYTVVR
jgi:pilus assembly protein CpaB